MSRFPPASVLHLALLLWDRRVNALRQRPRHDRSPRRSCLLPTGPRVSARPGERALRDAMISLAGCCRHSFCPATSDSPRAFRWAVVAVSEGAFRPEHSGAAQRETQLRSTAAATVSARAAHLLGPGKCHARRSARPWYNRVMYRYAAPTSAAVACSPSSE